MFYELNLIALVASNNNKKLILWDNERKLVICSTQFKTAIVGLKALKKLIFLATKEEINICNLNDNHNYIEIISKIPIHPLSNSAFDIWMLNNSSYYLSYVNEKSLIKLIIIYENYGKTQDIISFDAGFSDSPNIQNIIYNEKLNSLFIINEIGTSIKCYNCEDYSLVCEFYRGKNFAYISSISNIGDQYIAVASSNKTIHIFEINKKSKSSNNSYISKFYNFFKNPFNINRSLIKIRLNEISKDEEESGFFDLDFKTKGVLLLYEEELEELACLGYNGTIYFIKLDLENFSYKIINKYTWCVHNDSKNYSVYISDDFSFDLVSMNNKEDIKEIEKWKIV